MLAALAGLLLAAPASAQESDSGQTRAGFVAAAEQICKQDTARDKRILQGAQKRINHGNLVPAGHQFTRASRAYGASVTRIMRIPLPAAGEVRLKRWFKYLRIVQVRLRTLGRVLKAERKFQSNYAAIHVERSANDANNVGFPFGFKYCRFTRSRFS